MTFFLVLTEFYTISTFDRKFWLFTSKFDLNKNHRSFWDKKKNFWLWLKWSFKVLILKQADMWIFMLSLLLVFVVKSEECSRSWVWASVPEFVRLVALSHLELWMKQRIKTEAETETSHLLTCSQVSSG